MIERISTDSIEGELKGSQRFSTEARKALETEKHFITELNGETIASLEASKRIKDKNKYFRYNLYIHENEFTASILNKPSRSSEVAVNPRKIFIPGSNFKSISEQLEILEKYRARIVEKIPDVDVVMGELPDYAELCQIYEEQTDKNLFGYMTADHGSYKWRTPLYARTATLDEWEYEEKRFAANIDISGYETIRSYRSADNICLVPLILPSAPLK